MLWCWRGCREVVGGGMEVVVRGMVEVGWVLQEQHRSIQSACYRGIQPLWHHSK
jgi:hypothetical protein